MKINYYKLTESEMNDIPFSAGSLYRTTDTDKMYLDPINGSERILLEVESVNSLDTSDATATEDDIQDGCTAYVNGEKITGKVKVVRGGSIGYADSVSRIPMGDMSVFRIRGTIDEKSILSPDFGGISMDVPCTDFGDAEAADVAAGKTFTSAAGLKVTGSSIGYTRSKYNLFITDYYTETVYNGIYIDDVEIINNSTIISTETSCITTALMVNPGSIVTISKNLPVVSTGVTYYSARTINGIDIEIQEVDTYVITGGTAPRYFSFTMPEDDVICWNIGHVSNIYISNSDE